VFLKVKSVRRSWSLQGSLHSVMQGL
jgi:hypothetical protein